MVMPVIKLFFNKKWQTTGTSTSQPLYPPCIHPILIPNWGLMDMTDKMMLMKRSFIETIFSSIKLLGTLIHHRHRSPVNAFTHLFAGLISYQIREDKPSLHQLLKLNP